MRTGKPASRTVGQPLIVATIAMAVLISSPTAMAQNGGADQPSTREIIVTAQQARKQVISSGNIGVLGEKDPLDTPFNVTTYTAQLILDQQSETIGDVLKNDPSVRTTLGFGNQAELFVIRGFPLFGDDVAIDGLFGITPRQLVSPELYEGVQVLNGANAFLFGAAPGGSGVGGSINLTPKRARQTLLRATASFNERSVFGGNVDLGTRFGDDEAFGVRVNGVYRKGMSAIDDERREVNVVGAGLDFTRGPGRFYLDFGYERQRADASRPVVQLAANATVPDAPGAHRNYAQPWSFTDLEDIYVLARAEVDVTSDLLVYAAAGFRDGSEDGEYSTVTILNGQTGSATGGRLFVPREDNNESGQIGLRGKFASGPVTHEVNAGASVNFSENRNAFAFGAFGAALRAPCGLASAFSFCTNLYAPVTVELPANGFTGGDLNNVPRVSRGAFVSYFASDTLGAFDGRLLLTLGARHQSITVDAFNRTTLERSSRYQRSATTPMIGLVVRPAETLSFYANRVEGLAQGPVAPLNVNTLNAGEVFAPIKSTQYEIGGKLAIRGLTVTAAVYQIRQPVALNVPTPTPANPAAVTFRPDGLQRNRGFELSFNGEPSRFVRFIGGLTLNQARLQRTPGGLNDGNEAVGVPDFQANIGTEIVPPFLPDATFTARIVHTGEQQVDAANLRQIPGWTRLDLGLRYIIVADDRPITLRVSADNITNRGYWASSFNGYLVQGAPRTVKASMTVEF